MRSGRPASGPQSPEKPVSVPSAVAVLCPPRGACQRAWGPGWGSTGFRARGITVTRAGPTLPLLPDRVSWPQTATAIWRLLIPTRNAICKTGRPPSRELSPAGIPGCPRPASRGHLWWAVPQLGQASCLWVAERGTRGSCHDPRAGKPGLRGRHTAWPALWQTGVLQAHAAKGKLGSRTRWQCPQGPAGRPQGPTPAHRGRHRSPGTAGALTHGPTPAGRVPSCGAHGANVTMASDRSG